MSAAGGGEAGTQPSNSASAPRRQSKSLLPVVAVATAVVLWASAFLVIRTAGNDLSAGALALGRSASGAVALSAAMLLRRGWRPAFGRADGSTLAITLVWGAAWFGCYNLLLNLAERHTDAGTASLLVNIAPLLIGVLAAVLLRERVPLRLAAGLIVAFAGACLIAADSWGAGGDGIGLLCGLGAAGTYALCTVVQKPVLQRIDPLSMTWVGCLGGMLVLLPFGPELVQETGRVGERVLVPMLYLGFGPTATAFFCWGYALARFPAGRLAASTYLVPPLVVAGSVVLGAALPDATTAAGGALCLAGVLLAAVLRPRSRDINVLGREVRPGRGRIRLVEHMSPLRSKLDRQQMRGCGKDG